MARPRIIEFETGKVMLSGFPKEISNELEAYIAKFKQETPVDYKVPTVADVSDETNEKQFANKAVGLREKSPGQFEVVIVGYDTDTMEAQVEEVKNAGDFKSHATSVFMQEIVKRRLV